MHSRWLTTGSTFLDMWTRHHGLEGELFTRLETIIIYLVSLYFPMFFLIKVKHSWLEGPRHVLHELSLFRLQSPTVQDILHKTLHRSAWNSHSESILQTMVCSEEQLEREFAVKMILKLRAEKEEGDMQPRSRKNPKLHIDADRLENMISWIGAKEPVMTCKLSKEELVSLRETPMKVPYYPVHLQAIERAVKEVTEASLAVYGFERRDGWVRARAQNRKIMPNLSSKQDLVNLLN